MLSKGKLHLPLLQYGINMSQSIRLCVGHCLESCARRLEMGQSHRIGPVPLGLLSSQNGIIDGLLVLHAAPEVVGEEL